MFFTLAGYVVVYQVVGGAILKGSLAQFPRDAVRVMAGYDLSGPIEFTVSSLEVSGDRGFFMGTASRPGGVPIDITQTPLVTRDEIPVDFIDGASVQAFMMRAGDHWYVDAYAVGATDVWWMGPPFCAHYSAFLPAGAC